MAIKKNKLSFFFLVLLSIAVFGGCASKSYDADRKISLSAKLSETTSWRNVSEARKADIVFASLLNKLDKGYRLLVGGSFRDAYYEFDSILSDPRFVKYDEYLYAKFYLAEALKMLGIRYGSLVYFVDILKKEENKPYLEIALQDAISVSQEIKDDSLVLYLATQLTPSQIPEKLREEFRFFIAKNFYLTNNFENSQTLFKAIKPDNRLYLLAQYYLGVISVQEDDFTNAVRHFATISMMQEPEKYYDWSYLKDLSNMGIARLLFETGRFQQSVEYFNKVPKTSEIYAESLYEASWALYNWGKFNAALSILHTLHSPYYEITYFPRSILLKGAIFLELCMYKEAIATLKNLEQYYSEMKGLMDNFYAQAKSRSDYYRLLTGPENIRSDSQENPYRKLFQLASQNRDFLQMHKFVKKLNRELTIFSDYGNNKRALALAEHIKNKKASTTKKAIDLAIEKIQLTSRAIQDYMKSADIVRLEITTAERKLLEDKVKGYGREDSSSINIPAPIQSSVYIQDNYLFYKFANEYWKDELGYYLYNIESQCLAKDAR